jgi:hypothetical protein
MTNSTAATTKSLTPAWSDEGIASPAQAVTGVVSARFPLPNRRLGQAQDQQDPHQVRQEQVQDLQPDRGEEQHIRRARCQLHQQESSQQSQPALRWRVIDRPPAPVGPHDSPTRHNQRQQGVQQANSQKQASAGRDVLGNAFGQGARRKQGIAGAVKAPLIPSSTMPATSAVAILEDGRGVRPAASTTQTMSPEQGSLEVQTLRPGGRDRDRRAADVSSATQRFRTSLRPPGPPTRSGPWRTAQRRPRDSAKRRSDQRHRANTRTKASPLPRRWTNSMTVAWAGSSGRTTPLHSGQWLPQPAPEPVARTNAPHRMTPRLTARTTQANLA